MALSFLTTPLPRNLTFASNPLTTENGASQFLFHPPGSKYNITNRKSPGGSRHDPPYHWHLHQNESFHIKSGSTRVVIDGVEKVVSEGGTLTIPKGKYHTFFNASESEGLEVEIGLDPEARGRDEAFFRNLYGYQEDCRISGRAENIAQIFLFLYSFDCFPALPGPKVVMKPVSRALTWFIGVFVGSWLLGFRTSYPEYYRKAAE